MAGNDTSFHVHIGKNFTLILLALLFLPVSTLVLLLSYAQQQFASKSSASPISIPASRKKTVLVTGVGMTKGLALARLLYRAGHTVIGADFGNYSCGAVSKAITRFHSLKKPTSKAGSAEYVGSLLSIIKKEKVDLWVSCSGVASAVEDGEAKEVVERMTLCKAVQFDVETTKTLHEKDSFIEHTSNIGLTVPETHAIRSIEEVEHALEAGNGKHFIMKPIGMDDKSRGDMTLFPRPTAAETEKALAKMRISDEMPWIIQQYISGPEYCTHALIIGGEVKSFVACPSSELLMHYEALPPDSELSRAMLKFTRAFAIKGGSKFTGHLSFDFLVQEGTGEEGLEGLPVLYPIECNPRAHTAVCLFEDTPEAVDGYLALLSTGQSAKKKSDWTTDNSGAVVFPRNPQKYYWIGHDLVTLLLLPYWRYLTRQKTYAEVVDDRRVFVDHLRTWKDGTYETWDPLPWWWLYHVYWPVQFLNALGTGRPWSRINVSTTKMFEC